MDAQSAPAISLCMAIVPVLAVHVLGCSREQGSPGSAETAVLDGASDLAPPVDSAEEGGPDGLGDAGSDGSAESGALTIPWGSPAGVCSPDGWCWSHPAPFGGPIEAMWGAAPNDVWAATNRAVARWNGTRWNGYAQFPFIERFQAWAGS